MFFYNTPKLILTSFLLAVLSSCTTSGYKTFYIPYIDTNNKDLTQKLELLKPGETPQIFGTSDFDKDAKTLFLKSYVVLGESNFNGAYEDIRSVAKQAQRVGATVVLVDSKYTNTLTTTSALFIPTKQTTYHSGSINQTGNANTNGYVNYGRTTYTANTTYNSNTTYNGTSTTYGTQVIPYTTHQRRYDQRAMFFAKEPHKSKLGVTLETLTDEQKETYNLEFGMLINSVTNDSVAHHSNIITGDILYKINNQDVYGSISAEYLINKIDLSSKNTVTVIRHNQEIALPLVQ